MRIDRRRFIANAALLAGGSLSFGCLRAFDQYGGDARRTPREPVLDAGQRARLERAADLILPETDTPGALQAGVPDFVEMMISEYYYEDECQVILDGLDELERASLERTGAGFVTAPEDVQIEILTVLSKTGDEILRSQGANPMARFMGGPPAPPPAFFQSLRELIALGYTTSEVAARHVVEFSPFHADFEPCAPIDAMRRPEVM